MKQLLVNTTVMRAYLNGKTQTRRAIKQKIVKITGSTYEASFFNKKLQRNYRTIGDDEKGLLEFIKKHHPPKYKKGDKVWLREPAKVTFFNPLDKRYMECKYLADQQIVILIVPNRFKDIPDWICKGQGIPNGCIKELLRHSITITDIRVERLQDIKDEDIIKEGIKLFHKWENKEAEKTTTDNEMLAKQRRTEMFIALWNSTAQKGYKWDDNPFVFVYGNKEIK